MLVPRRLDQDGLRAYLDEVRPRFLVVRVRVERRTFTWGFPLSALEEIVGFALGAAAFAQAGSSWLPERWQDAMNGASTALVQALRVGRSGKDRDVPAASAPAAPTSGTAASAASASYPDTPAAGTASSSSPSPSPASALWATANDLAGGALRDVLRVPPGEPYVSVRSGRALIDVVAY